MREVCLSGIKLVSDQQPDRIRVDDHSSGPPSIWLHSDDSLTAWIIVDIGTRDWSKLAYQFGHELGHVLCNSWGRSAAPEAPCQWIEEAMVEAFSIHGLKLLAESWKNNPPFAGDNAFSSAIWQYRRDLIDKYSGSVDPSSYTDLGDWFHKSRSSLEQPGLGLNPIEGPAIVAIQAQFESEPACVADLGALNRWTARTAIPIEDYFTQWETSCAQLGAPGILPARLKSLLRLDT